MDEQRSPGELGPKRALSARPGEMCVGPARLRLDAGAFVVAAGPCAVETREQVEQAAEATSRAGAPLLRGGVHKPRTSPYAFQGLGDEGLSLLSNAGHPRGMATIAEVMEVAQIPRMLEFVDVLQVGARNMHNFSLLKALGKLRRPVLLKRGFSATVDEWLLAAEYLLEGGNDQVILCERGIRTFETSTRNTLDLASVALLKQRTRLPVWVDPSHATGRRELVIPMSLAAAAAGADGLLVEVHPTPSQALCDGAQALTFPMFELLMAQLRTVLSALGRELASAAGAPPATARSR